MREAQSAFLFPKPGLLQSLIIVLLVVILPCTGKADEEKIRRHVSGDEIVSYIDQQSQKQRLVSDLRVRIQDGQPIYDVMFVSNVAEVPWMVHVHSTDARFKAYAKKYEAEGFTRAIHRTVTIKGKKFHSAVWLQNKTAAQELILPSGKLPESGGTGRDLEPLNELMRRILTDNNLPGATVAVAHHGKLIFERGFGYSDIDSETPMAPTVNMRIASLSKPITAVAVLILVEDGKLDLEEKLLDVLARHPRHRFDVEAAVATDPRWKQITVRHLLQHSGGWDRDKSKDTIFQLSTVTQTLTLKHLARAEDIIQYQFKQPLDFDPGTEFAYSNVGYLFLGRVIEAISGRDYEEFVTARILKPAEMSQTRLGRTRLRDRAHDEVHYYTQKGDQQPAVWDTAIAPKNGGFEMVASPYGAWDLEVMDAHGGWTSTAGDLVRFIDAIDSERSPLLEKETRRLMLDRPSFANVSKNEAWYGLGWNVRFVNGNSGMNYWHTGSLAGTSTLMVRRWDGFTWAVLFNADRTKKGDRCSDIIDSEIHRAVNLSLEQQQ